MNARPVGIIAGIALFVFMFAYESVKIGKEADSASPNKNAGIPVGLTSPTTAPPPQTVVDVKTPSLFDQAKPVEAEVRVVQAPLPAPTAQPAAPLAKVAAEPQPTPALPDPKVGELETQVRAIQRSVEVLKEVPTSLAAISTTLEELKTRPAAAPAVTPPAAAPIPVAQVPPVKVELKPISPAPVHTDPFEGWEKADANEKLGMLINACEDKNKVWTSEKEQDRMTAKVKKSNLTKADAVRIAKTCDLKEFDRQAEVAADYRGDRALSKFIQRNGH